MRILYKKYNRMLICDCSGNLHLFSKNNRVLKVDRSKKTVYITTYGERLAEKHIDECLKLFNINVNYKDGNYKNKKISYL